MKDESSALESCVRLERKRSSTDRSLFLWRSVAVSTAVHMPDMCISLAVNGLYQHTILMLLLCRSRQSMSAVGCVNGEIRLLAVWIGSSSSFSSSGSLLSCSSLLCYLRRSAASVWRFWFFWSFELAASRDCCLHD